MKSIKEKSNEYAREYLFNTVPQKAPNEHFEAGANYVLEQIKEMLALKNQYTNKCDFCDDLEWRIEQLKK